MKLEKDFETYPPKVLEFKNLCKPEPSSSDGRGCGAGLNINDPKHPDHVPKKRMIENITDRERKKEVGQEALNNMMDSL